MESLVRCSTVQYAIIQASSKKDHPESLVIAYPGENCLRDLIAESSIVGLGFRSREEAMAKLLGSMPDSKDIPSRSIGFSLLITQDLAGKAKQLLGDRGGL
jgi:hypothetical protein